MAIQTLTNDTTTTTSGHRVFSPEPVEQVTQVVQPESVAMKVGDLEIIPLGDNRHRVLIAGKEVAVKELQLLMGLCDMPTVRMTWLPTHSEFRARED